MIKGLKHAWRCKKCGELTFADEFIEKQKKSECCNANNVYMGLQPYVTKVLIFNEPDNHEF